MNLRVLIYSNPLVVDKISKRFLFWKDSGFIFTKNLVMSLPSDFRFYWLVPNKLTKDDREWFLSANENIELIDYPYSTSIHQNRYEFYGNVLRDSFPYTKDIDIIINNQPEVGANLRVWAYNQRRDVPIIYSFYHWIDCAPSRKFAQGLGGYFWRQYDGALNSDAVYFHKGYAKNLWYTELEYRGVILNGVDVREFTPPPTKFGNDPIELPQGKKVILFNHRLNGTTNWKTVVDVCSKTYEQRQDFVLWMTDENGNMKNSSMGSLPFVISKHVPPEQYGFLIKNSHFSVCNHKGYSTWNMAVLDAICNGTFTIVPSDPVYLQMFGETDILFHDYDNLEKTIISLLDTDINDLRYRNSRVSEYVEKHLLLPNHEIENKFYEDISSRVLSTPRKYEKVVDLIKDGGTYKKDWVNGLWSFHTNSNFQKIRWKLLLDGVVDDVSQSETFYTAPVI
jgi:glycosyltransferase involved in cell wall biosynthesis